MGSGAAEVLVRGENGFVYTLSKAGADIRRVPVRSLVRALSRLTGEPSESHVLLFRGKPLSEADTAAGVGVEPGEQLTLRFRDPGTAVSKAPAPLPSWGPGAKAAAAGALLLGAVSLLAVAGDRGPELEEDDRPDPWVLLPPPEQTRREVGVVAGQSSSSLDRWRGLLHGENDSSVMDLPDVEIASLLPALSASTPGRGNTLTAQAMDGDWEPPRVPAKYEPQRRIELPGKCLDVYEAYGWENRRNLIRKVYSVEHVSHCCDACARDRQCAAWTHYSPFAKNPNPKPTDFVCSLYSTAEGATFCSAENRCTSGRGPERSDGYTGKALRGPHRESQGRWHAGGYTLQRADK
eukprot:TRINITY_DN30797_c0_g1_i1.p1 TRINITY_DN30797_c0_g1~~TRINITY_DN30797_c0_g1_i1.p1  ORF type:complete len:350 (+),score=72.65 TRINITY_DN30797_c0_g1_i1:79-1128(+)